MKSTLVFSYSRFSSGRQARGTSIRRQIEDATVWCKENGHELDESLALSDLGVSAYTGINASRGALAGFLTAIAAGKVPRGSILIVESLDRLSRAALPEAMALLTSIVRAGVKVVSLIDRKVWDEETIEDTMAFMMSVLLFSRAHEESSTKARRVSKAFQIKRADRLPVVSKMHGPGWVKPKPDLSGWMFITDKAKAVRRVFRLAAEGHGGVAIARRANQEGWPVPWRPRVNSGKGWEHTAISRLLRDRRALGEWQPHRMVAGQLVPDGEVVAGYFPAVIDEDLWHRVQIALQGRPGPKRLRGINADILAGLFYCRCGERMERKAAAARGSARYYCVARKAGRTNCPPIAEAVAVTKIFDLIALHEQEAFRGDDEVVKLRELIILDEERLASARRRADNLLKNLEASEGSPLILRRLKDVETEIANIEGEMVAAREKIATVPLVDHSFAAKMTAIAQNAIEDRAAVTERFRLASTLNRIVDRIDWGSSVLTVYAKGGHGYAAMVSDKLLGRAKRRDAGQASSLDTA